MVSIATNICFHSALQLSEAGVEKLKSETRGVCTVVLRGWKLKHPPGVSDVLNSLSPPAQTTHTLFPPSDITVNSRAECLLGNYYCTPLFHTLDKHETLSEFR